MPSVPLAATPWAATPRAWLAATGPWGEFVAATGRYHYFGPSLPDSPGGRGLPLTAWVLWEGLSLRVCFWGLGLGPGDGLSLLFQGKVGF